MGFDQEATSENLSQRNEASKKGSMCNDNEQNKICIFLRCHKKNIEDR